MLNDKTVNNKLIKQQATSFKKVGCLLVLRPCINYLFGTVKTCPIRKSAVGSKLFILASSWVLIP